MDTDAQGVIVGG